MATADDKERLEIVASMIEEYLVEKDMLLSTQSFLYDLLSVFSFARDLDKKEQKIIISTASNQINDKSIVSIVVDTPFSDQQSFSKIVPSKSMIHRSYDAIYEGLTSFFSFVNNPQMSVEVHSDDQLCIKQLRKETKLTPGSTTEVKRDSILELVEHLPVEIRFKWMPTRSTTSMKLANKLTHGDI